MYFLQDFGTDMVCFKSWLKRDYKWKQLEVLYEWLSNVVQWCISERK